ncbi:MAG: response regulator transcription factor [Oscillospiraceae bacterium]|nr:response regulator transcription factor [Oscillospiraceae bacterium]
MIWCIEDDANIRDIEVYTLASTGFEAKGFSCADELFAALEEERPELILLDIMLPGQDGVETLRRLKADPETEGIPIIMATAKGSEFDKIRSLDLGADDYLVKPFGMMEMVSRVKAVLRRCRSAPVQHILHLDGLSVNLDERTVTVDAARVQLTYKEFELLRLFLENPGMVFTRDQLFSRVWGMDYIAESRTVDMHIRTLRQKIAPYGERIETVRNVGYRMEAGR